MRYVTLHGVVYYRAEDVAEYVRTLGATEETDVRNRLHEAATHLCTPCEGSKGTHLVTPSNEHSQPQ